MKSELVAKKKFSQNFLVDPAGKERVKKQVLEFLEKYPDRPVIEIGPGQGDITQWLIDIGKSVLAIEIDEDAVNYLELKFNNSSNISIIQGDAMDLIIKQSLPENAVLVSNLPYHIGSRLLVELGQHYPQMPFAVILQKEVVEKITTRQMFTFFGSFIYLYWNCKRVMDLPPNYFYPQPRVYSSMMIGIPKFNSLIEKSPQIFLNLEKRVELKNTLKSLFINPSKTLNNNLKHLGWDKSTINQFLTSDIQGVNLTELTRLSWNNYEQILMSVVSQ